MSAALLVADSGPLIALARLDRLKLPARYFDSVLVTVTVWDEVTRKPDAAEMPRLISALTDELIKVVPEPESIPDAVRRHTIDVGRLHTFVACDTCSSAAGSREQYKHRTSSAVALVLSRGLY